MKKNIPYVIIIRETEIKKRDDYMYKDPFKEYIRQSEPNKRDKGYAWHTAIGLQAVDGLKTSKILRVIFLLMRRRSFLIAITKKIQSLEMMNVQKKRIR